MRLLGLIVVLVVLAVAGLTGYAYVGDMKADPKEMRVPVELDLGSPATDTPAAVTPAAAPAPEAETPAPAPAAPASDNTQPDAHDLD
ncbi:hypothetical protein [Paracoccus aminophilus]|uniref:Uncharacterized protein n=1 Tax=Paracoccus aminophilus JCM 7686 TaxID=1367847 RepID=S5YB55_PARAH|nr:hypothetical protein [Paracoccus aminophilus]AGT08668.1 hypothetical protein JCM7686_1567 [Paracoccus aminophilus JCM 7686]